MTDLAWDSYRYRVRAAELVTPVIRELWLEPVGESMGFRPGQYLLLSSADYSIPPRSYSIANAPRADGMLSILVTLVAGGPTSTWAHQISMYDEVSVEGPFGTFVADPAWAGPVLLLGAGSGLAPLRALAEDLLGAGLLGAPDPDSGKAGVGSAGVIGAAVVGATGATGAAVATSAADANGPGRGIGPVTLFFSGRTRSDAIDRARFETWERAIPRFDYRITFTREARESRHTRIPELLATEFESLRGTAIFAAGPPGFVAGCRTASEALGAHPADIRTEEFFAEPAGHQGVPAGEV